MIFHWIYARRVERFFRPYMSNEVWSDFHRKHLATISEWHALKMLLPSRWFHSSEDIDAGYREVALMARQVLDDHERNKQQGGTADRNGP